MNIGQVAAASGVSAKMIRHYEAIGLIRPAERSASGYRRYGPADVGTLRFVLRARAAGFSLAEIGDLVALWLDRARPAREVRRIAAAHLEELEGRIEAIRAVAASLAHLVGHCRGDERPECPILDAFAGDSDAGSRQGRLVGNRATGRPGGVVLSERSAVPRGRPKKR